MRSRKCQTPGKALGKGLSELRQAVSGEASNVINIEGKLTESKPREEK